MTKGGKENTQMGMCMIGQAKGSNGGDERRTKGGVQPLRLCRREKRRARERQALTVNYSGGQERCRISAAALNVSVWHHLLITGIDATRVCPQPPHPAHSLWPPSYRRSPM